MFTSTIKISITMEITALKDAKHVSDNKTYNNDY